MAKSVDIALSSRQLTEPRHVDTILLENGTLNLTDQTAPLPFKADRLQLRDMAFNPLELNVVPYNVTRSSEVTSCVTRLICALSVVILRS